MTTKVVLSKSVEMILQQGRNGDHSERRKETKIKEKIT